MKKIEEADSLYVLRRMDGTVFAELMMTPSMAAQINQRRRERGTITGDWEPQPLQQYGLWHLDSNKLLSDVFTLSKDEAATFNRAIPDTMRTQWLPAGAENALD